MSVIPTASPREEDPAPPAPVLDYAAPAPPRKETLKHKVLKASFWTAFTTISTSLLRLGSNLFLAHLLVPEQFGTMALVMAFITGLNMFSDIGVGPNIINSPHGDEPRFYNTAFTVQAIRGGLIWLATLIMAWPVAHSYGNPMMMWYLPVAGLQAIIYGVSSTSVFTLTRRHQQRSIAQMAVNQVVLNVLVMGVWAYIHPSVWALVAGSLCTQLYRTIHTHMLLPEIKNRFHYDREAAQQMFKFGSWIFVSTVITFFANQLDSFWLGFLSLGNLGLYKQAMNVAGMPRDLSSSLMERALYPALAEKARAGHHEMTVALQKARRLVLPCAMYGLLGVCLVADLFFTYLYKPMYHDSAWIAQIMCLGVWFITLQLTVDRALLAMGDSMSIAIATLVRLGAVALGCWLGQKYFGFKGFIWGASLSYVAGYTVIAITMLRHKIYVIGQDVQYTLMLAVLALVGTLAPRLLAQQYPRVRPVWFSIAIAVLFLCTVGIWVLQRVRRELSNMRRKSVVAG